MRHHALDAGRLTVTTYSGRRALLVGRGSHWLAMHFSPGWCDLEGRRPGRKGTCRQRVQGRELWRLCADLPRTRSPAALLDCLADAAGPEMAEVVARLTAHMNTPPAKSPVRAATRLFLAGMAHIERTVREVDDEIQRLLGD